MLITICDKCGSRIEENKGRFIFEMDFCPDCTEKLKQVVQAWIDEPEEKKIEVSEEDFKKIADQVRKDVENEIAQKKIDWNKACALKLAGWSNKDIAIELKANEGTINSGIYGKLKTYRPGEHYDD